MNIQKMSLRRFGLMLVLALRLERSQYLGKLPLWTRFRPDRSMRIRHP